MYRVNLQAKMEALAGQGLALSKEQKASQGQISVRVRSLRPRVAGKTHAGCAGHFGVLLAL